MGAVSSRFCGGFNLRLVDRYEGFIIDLDGVIYLLHDLIPGSAGVIHHMQEAGIPFIFLTNNSSSTPRMYVDRLRKHGIEIGPGNIVSPPAVIKRNLEMGWTGGREGAGGTAFVVGEEGLTRQIEEAGLELVSGEKAKRAEYVFVGWDRNLTYEKLKTAVVAIRNGARYIATNTDATYPTPEGLWPGAGSIVAAVTCGSGREPEVAGKPNPQIVELALERMGVEARSALLVGDRLDTDIAAGLAAGVDTLLVLTGVSSALEAEETGMRPTHIRDNFGALLDP